MSTLSDKIVQVALSYVGQREIGRNNAGFENPEFQKKLAEMGWHKGEAWCAYQGELIWKEAFGHDHPQYALLDKLFSASAVSSWSNFVNSNVFKTGKVPKPGALAIFRHGDSWKGHMTVVVPEITEKRFATVEGNSNNTGGRDGDLSVKSSRPLSFDFKPDGLNLLGFVYPE
jgi:hypothetical protein